MDEPFTGLDPVNVALLKEAFLEMRERGKTLIFSTHQMDMVEELCDAVAIIDARPPGRHGPTRDVKRSTGKRVVRLGVGGRPGPRRGSPSCDGVRVARSGRDYTELEVVPTAGPGDDPAPRRSPTRAGHAASRSPTRRSSRSSSSSSAAGGVRRERTLAACPEREGLSDGLRPSAVAADRPPRVPRPGPHAQSFRIATVISGRRRRRSSWRLLVVRWFDRDSTAKVGVPCRRRRLRSTRLACLGCHRERAAGAGGRPAFTFSAVRRRGRGARRGRQGRRSRRCWSIARGPAGDLTFTIVSKDGPALRTPTLAAAGRRACWRRRTASCAAGSPGDQIGALACRRRSPSSAERRSHRASRPKDMAGEVGGTHHRPGARHLPVHRDRPVRPVGRDERGRGEEQPGHGDRPQRGDARSSCWPAR